MFYSNWMKTLMWPVLHNKLNQNTSNTQNETNSKHYGNILKEWYTCIMIKTISAQFSKCTLLQVLTENVHLHHKLYAKYFNRVTNQSVNLCASQFYKNTHVHTINYGLKEFNDNLSKWLSVCWSMYAILYCEILGWGKQSWSKLWDLWQRVGWQKNIFTLLKPKLTSSAFSPFTTSLLHTHLNNQLNDRTA